jgi:hypothetical protein
LRTPLDTSGEKPYEEFIGTGESALELGMTNLLAVKYSPSKKGAVRAFLDVAEKQIGAACNVGSKSDIVQWLEKLVPELQHRETGKCLDSRM